MTRRQHFTEEKDSKNTRPGLVFFCLVAYFLESFLKEVWNTAFIEVDVVGFQIVAAEVFLHIADAAIVVEVGTHLGALAAIQHLANFIRIVDVDSLVIGGIISILSWAIIVLIQIDIGNLLFMSAYNISQVMVFKPLYGTLIGS